MKRQPTNHLINFLIQTLALSSDSANERDVNIPVVDRSPAVLQTENPTSSLSNGPIEQPEITEQQVHQKCRAVVLYECGCRLQVDASAEDVIQCKHKGCETIWVSTHI